MKKQTRFNLIFVLIAILGVIVLQQVMSGFVQDTTIPYSQFQSLLHDGKVSQVVITQDRIMGQLKDPLPGGQKNFVTNRVDEKLADALNQAGVKYSQAVQSGFLSAVFSWVVPMLLFFGLWMLFMRYMASRGGMGGQFMSIGKSKAKVYVENESKVTFEDVAGVDEAKDELIEVVNFLKEPKKYSRLGGKMPKGVLLVGPPGTGKTLLAKAVAGEAHVPFFFISGSDFVEMFVGVGAARVRDLFEQARQRAPAIIFIDELDAVGRARGVGIGGGGHDEKEQTLNQLLTELDGFDSSTGLVLLGATNRPEILDPALLRAGRFDRQILVDRPDKRGREAILRVHTRGLTLAPHLALEQIAALTPGFTGADLANLCNEAALAATRREADLVELDDFTAAMERIVAGLERKNRLLNEDERRIVAHHEMGHALVAAALPGVDPVHKISIIPRGIGALGYTLQRPTEDRFLMRREELEAKMTVLLGGRAAEQVVFQHLSTGASDDLAKATDIARSMVTRYGMDDALGSVAYEAEQNRFLGPLGQQETRRYSEQTAHEIDEAIQRLVAEALQRALSILRENESVLLEGAQNLLEHETLDEAELHPFFAKLRTGPIAEEARRRAAG
ncbi:MAG TPA: ATP-dependent zinc metalloprotease FtsH [bacterium]|nr:ATP-dependent zinc metalloprotease FtsH [bacterium]